jgi:hypothetical protein
VVGDKYAATSVTAGAGRPWEQQYDINLTQSGDITGWTTDSTLQYYSGQGTSVMIKNKIAFFYSNNSYNSTYVADVQSNGVLSNINIRADFSPPQVPRLGACIVTVNNYVYLIGGYVNGSGVYSTDVYRALINSDGTLGSWILENNTPNGIGGASAFVTNNRIYVVGGSSNNGSVSNKVYTCLVNPDGSLGAWSVDSTLPANMDYSSLIVIKNKVYILGFNNGGSGTSTVYTATINTNGTITAFTANGSLPTTITISKAFATRNTAYLLVGNDGTNNNLRKLYYAPINADGSLGTWTLGTLLPYSMITVGMHVFITGSKIYLLSQDNNSNNRVIYANITGGINDASPYYGVTMTPTDPANFSLPDLTPYDVPGGYSYIKI